MINLDFKKSSNNVLMEIYSSKDSSSFVLGYLIGEINNFYVFQTIDEYGCVDSYKLYQKNHVAKVEYNTNYIKVFKEYIDFQNKIGAFDSLNLNNIFLKVPMQNINTILNYCIKNKMVISMTAKDYEYQIIGEAIKIDNKTIILDQHRYYHDLQMAENAENEAINISSILTLDIVNKENYLYGQYLKES